MLEFYNLLNQPSLNILLQKAHNLSKKNNDKFIYTHHLLIAVLENLKIDKFNNCINLTELENEVTTLNHSSIEEIAVTTLGDEFALSSAVINILKLASKYCLYFNDYSYLDNYLMLSILDFENSVAYKILESTGVNILAIKQLFISDLIDLNPQFNFKNSILQGIRRLIKVYSNSLEDLNEIDSYNTVTSELIAFRVTQLYLNLFLDLQINFSRLILEKNLKTIDNQAGPLNNEIQSAVISLAASNLKIQVKEVIEQIFSHECHLLNNMPTESEYEQIGIIVEDLWWSYGEALTLEDLYCAAQVDHRKKHLLNLQQSKLQIYDKLMDTRSKLKKSVNKLLNNHPVLKESLT